MQSKVITVLIVLFAFFTMMIGITNNANADISALKYCDNINPQSEFDEADLGLTRSDVMNYPLENIIVNELTLDYWAVVETYVWFNPPDNGMGSSGYWSHDPWYDCDSNQDRFVVTVFVIIAPSDEDWWDLPIRSNPFVNLWMKAWAPNDPPEDCEDVDCGAQWELQMTLMETRDALYLKYFGSFVLNEGQVFCWKALINKNVSILDDPYRIGVNWYSCQVPWTGGGDFLEQP